MKKIKLVISLVLLLGSSNVFAGSATGKVTFLAVNDQDQVHVITETRGTSIPSCVTTDSDRLVTDLATEHGKAIYSLLLSAQAQGLDVQIGGKNSCNIRTGMETIQYVIVRP